MRLGRRRLLANVDDIVHSTKPGPGDTLGGCGSGRGFAVPGKAQGIIRQFFRGRLLKFHIIVEITYLHRLINARRSRFEIERREEWGFDCPSLSQERGTTARETSAARAPGDASRHPFPMARLPPRGKRKAQYRPRARQWRCGDLPRERKLISEKFRRSRPWSPATLAVEWDEQAAQNAIRARRGPRQ